MTKNQRKWGLHFDIAGAKEKVTELEEISADPDFWGDMEKSQKVLVQLKGLKNKINRYETLVTQYEDILTLIEMGTEEEDASIISEVQELTDNFLAEYDNLKISTLLDGEYDKNNAIVTLHSGAGGTEACDWTNMLFRMYTKWADRNDFQIEILDMLDGDEAGLKSVTIQVNGENAYGYLKSEKGRHPGSRKEINFIGAAALCAVFYAIQFILGMWSMARQRKSKQEAVMF